LLYRISEGGAMPPFNSSMPAWKNTLKENDIWQVISYLKTLK
jgi:mono/diheme cytochrome c family protein